MTESAQSAPTRRRPVQVPEHVPDDLVFAFPFYVGARTQVLPQGLYADVHRNPPVFWAEMTSIGSAWVPRRMRELRQIYLDNENFSVGAGSHFAAMVGETWCNVPSEIDPPLHTTLRSAINPLFIPRRMAALEDRVRHYARNAIARFKHRGHCELMQEFAFEFPIRVFLELMGLPQDDMEQCLAWEHALLHATDLETARQATLGVTRYLREQIEARRRRPREDFISYGIALEAGGRALTEDELMGFCFNLFVGGLDTVSTNIGHQFRHLAENPEHQALLRENPGRIGEAIEEFMRAYASSVTPRTCIREVEIGGVTMRPGDRVLMATFLGNSDPEEFDDPDKVILERKPRHVGFGFGPHMCIGMHLANREMRIAIEEMFAELPPFRIAPGETIESWLGGMITPVALPLAW